MTTVYKHVKSLYMYMYLGIFWAHTLITVPAREGVG